MSYTHPKVVCENQVDAETQHVASRLLHEIAYQSYRMPSNDETQHVASRRWRAFHFGTSTT